MSKRPNTLFRTVFLACGIGIATISTASETDLVINVHQVGAGNCITVQCPAIDANGTHPREALIVDCGSLGSVHKMNVLDLVHDELKDTEKLTILLTHPDIDHYKWVPDILQRLSSIQQPLMSLSAVYYGGFWDSYSTQQANSAIVNHGDISTTFFGAGGLNQAFGTHQPLPLGVGNGFQCGTAQVDILAALDPHSILPPSKQYNKNAASLIIQLKGNGFTMLFPGDANNRPIKSALQLTGSPLKSDAVVVPHHGSQTQGSKNQIWSDAISARYIIVSPGANEMHEKHRNPNYNALTTYIKAFDNLNSNNSMQVTSHTVTAYQENGINKGWKQLTTDTPIFSTFDYGRAQIIVKEDQTFEMTCPDASHNNDGWCKNGIK